MSTSDVETIDIFALGAGQDVGRSCILLRARGQQLLLDCGAHLAYNDHRRFPDFRQLLQVAQRTEPALPCMLPPPSLPASSTVLPPPSPPSPFTALIDGVLLTHFHLDHCGALPVFTERCGYRGPLLMTAPTRALTPIVLTDFWRLQVERRGVSEAALFSRAEIETSVRRAHCMQLHEEFRINARVSVQAHYAGHVLGAVMFLIRIDAPPEPLVPSASPPSVYPGGSNQTSASSSSFHHLAPSHHRSIAVASSPSLARAPLFILYSGDIHHAAAAHLGAFSLARLPPPLSGAFGAALGVPSVGALGRASATATAAKKSAVIAGSGGLGGLADALRPPAQNPALHSPHALSVLITESTYAGTIRDSALEQEREFLSLVLDCVLRRRGRVLVPVFALGKAQELCALLERCWARLGLDVPIYFAPGMAERASAFFRVHAQWGSHATRQESVPTQASAASGASEENAHHSTPSTTSSLPSASLSSRPPLQRPATLASVWRPDPRQQNHHGTGFAAAPAAGTMLDAAAGLDGSPFGASAAEQPCVLFASPGMLQGGLALDVFRAWAPDARNAVIFPASCIEGTIGHLVQAGAKSITSTVVTRHSAPHATAAATAASSGETIITTIVTTAVRCRVARVAMTVHADLSGIARLISQTRPRHVVLVHGEPHTMRYLCEQVTRHLGLPCHMPANGKLLRLTVPSHAVAALSAAAAESARATIPLASKRNSATADSLHSFASSAVRDDSGEPCRKIARKITPPSFALTSPIPELPSLAARSLPLHCSHAALLETPTDLLLQAQRLSLAFQYRCVFALPSKDAPSSSFSALRLRARLGVLGVCETAENLLSDYDSMARMALDGVRALLSKDGDSLSSHIVTCVAPHRYVFVVDAATLLVSESEIEAAEEGEIAEAAVPFASNGREWPSAALALWKKFGAAAISGSALHCEISVAGEVRARFSAAGAAVVLDATYTSSGRSALLLLAHAAEALFAA